ncbi:MAG: T9SS type A sorting domain-containing protein [Ignavibacteriae bacterium]|nr:T9SS type A sorting domain-containing protein [Ignavibacteriota bacterium]
MKTRLLARNTYFLLLAILLSNLTVFGFDNTQSNVEQSYKIKADKLIKNKPVSFIENKGQVFDTDNKLRSDIKFTLKQKDMTAYFLKDRVAFVRTTPSDKKGEQNIQRNDLILVGSNSNTSISGKDEQTETYNFYSRDAMTHDARSYQSVIYHNVYPNIDMVFMSQNGNLKYDVIVHPGGDISKFQYRYDGAKSVSIKKGDLIIEQEKSKFVESIPESYSTSAYNKGTDKSAVKVKFSVDNNVIGFKVGKYNKSKDLVVDPTLVWSTYVGAFGGQQTYTDVVNSADFDAEGNLYAVGYTTSYNFPVVSTLYGYLAGEDAFIMKYDPTGALVWSCVYHGENDENALSVDVDPTNNHIFFCGYTSSPLLFPILNAAQPIKDNGQDGFVACVDNNCNILWSTYWGGAGEDVANDVYSAGFTSITGTTSSHIFAIGTLPWAADPDYNGGLSDAYATLFATNGIYMYNTFLGGNPGVSTLATGEEEGNGIVNAVEGNNFALYITGNTNNQIFANTLQTVYSGGADDGFVMKVDIDYAGMTSAMTWSTIVGDAGDDKLNDICFGLNGWIAVVGATNSPTLTDPAWGALLFNTNHRTQYSALTLTDRCGFPIPTLPPGNTYDVLAIPFTNAGVPASGGGMYGDIWDEFGNDIKYGRDGYYIAGTSFTTTWHDYPQDDNYWGITTNPFMDSFRDLNTLSCAFNISADPTIPKSKDGFLMKLERLMQNSYWITPYKGVLSNTMTPGSDDGDDEGLGVAVYTGLDIPVVSLVGKTLSTALPMINNNPFMLMTPGSSSVFDPLCGCLRSLPDGYIATFSDESKFPTFFGGDTGDETVEDIARDLKGNYYIVGATTSKNLNLDTENDPDGNFTPDFTTGFPTYMPTKTTITAGPTAGQQAFPYPLRKTARLNVPGDVAGFIIKFDANGNRIFSAFIGRNTADFFIPGSRPPVMRDPVEVHPTCVTVDKDNNPIIGGFATEGSDLTLNHDYATDVFTGGTIASYQPNVTGRKEAFLLKLNSQGERLAATYYGGPSNEGCASIPVCNGDDVITDVTSDAEGNIIACGFTNSLINIASPTGAYQELNRQNIPLAGFEAGRFDGFVVKFNPTLTTRAWGTYMGGLKDDFLNGITMDFDGSIAVTGSTESAVEPITYPFVNPGIGVTNEPTPSIFPAAQTADVAISKFDPNGVVLWSKVFGAPLSTVLGADLTQSNDRGMAITQNFFTGSYVVTGTTNSNGFIDTDLNPRSHPNDNNDAILVRFDPSNGQRLQTRWFGREGNEDGDAIVCVGEDIYITGGTSSTIFPLPGILKGAGNLGLLSAYVARFSKFCQVKDHAIMGGIGPDAGTGICSGWNLGYEETPVQICGFTRSGILGVPPVDPFAFQTGNNGGPTFQDGFSANFSFNLEGWRKESNPEPTKPTIIPVKGAIQLQAYPNPAKDFVTLNMQGVQGTLDIEVTDILGKVLIQKHIDAKDPCNFDTRSLPTGTYFVTLKSAAQGTARSTFIKQ